MTSYKPISLTTRLVVTLTCTFRLISTWTWSGAGGCQPATFESPPVFFSLWWRTHGTSTQCVSWRRECYATCFVFFSFFLRFWTESALKARLLCRHYMSELDAREGLHKCSVASACTCHLSWIRIATAEAQLHHTCARCWMKHSKKESPSCIRSTSCARCSVLFPSTPPCA